MMTEHAQPQPLQLNIPPEFMQKLRTIQQLHGDAITHWLKVGISMLIVTAQLIRMYPLLSMPTPWIDRLLYKSEKTVALLWQADEIAIQDAISDFIHALQDGEQWSAPEVFLIAPDNPLRHNKEVRLYNQLAKRVFTFNHTKPTTRQRCRNPTDTSNSGV